MEQPVTFQSDGQQVVGMLHLPDSVRDKVPGVLFLHGFTGNKLESHRLFVLTARALAQAGMASLRFDFRGSGDSEGDFSEATISSETQDAREALQYLRRQPPIDPDRIGLVAMSMGALVAALLLGEGAEVKAGVFWSSVTDTVAAVKRRGGATTAAQLAAKGYADLAGWPVGRQFIHELAAAHPLKAIVKANAPLLLIHGDQDQSVPMADTEACEAALQKAGRTVKKIIIAGAGHTYDSMEWVNQLVGHTASWLQRYI